MTAFHRSLETTVHPVGPGKWARAVISETEPPERTTVLVVGGGPVGLAAALELAHHGIQATVVERDGGSEPDQVRARGFHSRTVEHFRRWSVAAELRRRWTVPPEWLSGAGSFTSITGHRLETARPRPLVESLSPERPIGRPQYVLRNVLLDAAIARGVTVVAGWNAVASEQDSLSVQTGVIRLSDGSSRSIRSDYVIAADGAGSAIRTSAGIATFGPLATAKDYNVSVDIPGSYARAGIAPRSRGNAGIRVFNNSGSGLFTPYDESRWGLPVGPFDRDYEASEEELLGAARARFGLSADAEIRFDSASSYLVGFRIAERFSAGRIFVAGDAAHSTPPYLGINLTTGIGDVVNLVWKIAAVTRGWGSPVLLESYDAERRPHALRVAEATLVAGENADELGAIAHAFALPAEDDLSAEAEAARAELAHRLRDADRFGSLGAEFDEYYEDSPVISYQDHRREPWRVDRYTPVAGPGGRSPHLALGNEGLSILDRFGTGLTLVHRGADEAVADFATAAHALAVPLGTVRLRGDQGLGPYPSRFTLVRPDQHVVWMGEELPPIPADLLYSATGRSPVTESPRRISPLTKEPA